MTEQVVVLTQEQFELFLACVGFGFGSIFWLVFSYILFAWRGHV